MLNTRSQGDATAAGCRGGHLAGKRESIARLPQKQEEVFRLSRMEHLSIEEIAQRLNISKRTVENYITAALKTLRGSLGEFLVLVLWVAG
ncbi:MAG: HTH domain-containing protein [Cyclobacteriaceae bacterium]|nr:HTH domain-containing protein [Cyclobacteriaceae bacterium]